MKDTPCPKCDESVRPIWHACCKKDKENKQISDSAVEHLHYFCHCNFDFVRHVVQDEVY